MRNTGFGGRGVPWRFSREARRDMAAKCAQGVRLARWRRLLAGIAVVLMLPGTALADCTISKFGEFPVTMRGLRPIVSATIDGKPVEFLADSGAFFSMITAGSARELKLVLQPAPERLRVQGIGGSIDVNVTTVTFGISGATIPRVEFLVGGGEFGVTGMLGQNFLGIHDVEYDLPHSAIRLMQTRGCEKANLAYWAKPGETYSVMPTAPSETGDHHTIGEIEINGKHFRAIFDTGAGLSMLSRSAAARIGLTPTTPGAEPGGLASGIGRQVVPTWIVPVETLKLGDETIEHAHLRIGEMGLLDGDMLIGADFFISHRVFVANSQHRIFFSYLGGPVFNLSAHAAQTGPERPLATTAAVDADQPNDAAAFDRRGAVRAADHDYPGAIADFTQAIALAPGEARYREQRAGAYLQNKQEAAAAADIDKAIDIAPTEVEARLARAALRIRAKDEQGAIADLDVADRNAPPAADSRLELAELYDRAGWPDRSIPLETLWLDNHPEDARRPVALNARCWDRALADKELPQALADCNAANRLRPHMPGFMDSRGMVELRMGQFDKAVADYDAALAVNAKLPWSLYGRGTAEVAQGKIETGQADIAAAVALDPRLPDLAKRYGIAR